MPTLKTDGGRNRPDRAPGNPHPATASVRPLEHQQAIAPIVQPVNNAARLLVSGFFILHRVEWTLPATQVAAVGQLVTGKEWFATFDEVTPENINRLRQPA